MALQDELVELERGFGNAIGSPDYYRENMADEGVAVFSSGVMDKHGAIQSTSAPGMSGWTDVRIEGPRLVRFSEDAAALVYKGSAKRDGEPYSANSSSVYVKRHGTWRMILHQQSAR